MKKGLLLLITFIFIFPIMVKAQTGIIDGTTGVVLRKGPGTSYAKIVTVPFQKEVNITDTKATDDNTTGCPSKKWYYASYGSNKGYLCSDFIVIKSETPEEPEEIVLTDMGKMTDEEFDAYLTKQGFPNDYKKKLKKLHNTHPNWVFKGLKSKYSWTNAMKEEKVIGRSLLQVNSTGVANGLQGYLNTSSTCYDYTTDKFKAYDGSTWFQANDQAIAYYLDPRNFLTESGIFMFEDLTYYPSYQTIDVVKKILYSDFFANKVTHYITAAEKYNVSPIFLAALTRQEVGLNSSTATSGKAGTFNGKDYNGLYNFYNIGASSSANPVYKGLDYSREKGWTTVKKAIVGGAGWIVSGYIDAGQYTQYLQKWNVGPDAKNGIWHQYMTNIKALVGPSSNTAASYKSMKIIDEPIVFTIPIFTSMPESTKLPATGNPNNYLKTLKVDGTGVSGFKGATEKYNLGTVEYSKTTIEIKTTTVNSNASVDGAGKVTLGIGENTIKLVVTAQNGAKKTYTLTITRKDKPVEETTTPTTPTTPTIIEPSVVELLNKSSIKNNDSYVYGFKLSTKTEDVKKTLLNNNPNSITKITDSSSKNKDGILATGDIITITSNNETKKYKVIIYGDLNGDGKINAKDLLLMRKHLAKTKSLKGAYLVAGYLKRQNKINAKDLLVLRKYLLNKATISQV